MTDPSNLHTDPLLSPSGVSSIFLFMDTLFSNLHVAIISSPSMGHLIPSLVLAHRLAANHDVQVTVLAVAADASTPETTCCLNLRHHLIRIVHLPPPDISHLVTPSTHVVARICLTIRESLPLIRSAVVSMDRRPDALVSDLFCTETASLAAELCLCKYLYVPTTAWFTALTLYCPFLDQEIAGQYVHQLEAIQIPGCKSVRPWDLVDPMLDRDDQQYHEYKKMGKRFLLFDGILLNTWEDLEPQTLHALRENQAWRSIMKIPTHPIGPLRRPVESTEEETELILWLDRQPDDSVVFISFGSGGTLSAEQTSELARGLELSRQRFVWVVRRPPIDGTADAAYFDQSHGGGAGHLDYLPDGFAERIRDRGFLVPAWAPQARVLAHRAVGGFMSHCGWNSTLESLTSGVPMVAWPLYAEQRMNATLLVEDAGVALRPGAMPGRAVVSGEEVEGLLRRLMEGEEGRVMREKVKRLRLIGMEGLSKGGRSHEALRQVLYQISCATAHKLN